MMSLANQTVEKFFQEANWQGLKLTQNDQDQTFVTSDFIEVDCHLGLTVEEYFSLNNWQGIARRHTTSNYRTSSVVEPEAEFSLTISVAEFFEQMVWHKRTKKVVQIASPPVDDKPQASSPKTKKTFNFQDLSDLI